MPPNGAVTRPDCSANGKIYRQVSVLLLGLIGVSLLFVSGCRGSSEGSAKLPERSFQLYIHDKSASLTELKAESVPTEVGVHAYSYVPPEDVDSKSVLLRVTSDGGECCAEVLLQERRNGHGALSIKLFDGEAFRDVELILSSEQWELSPAASLKSAPSPENISTKFWVLAISDGAEFPYTADFHMKKTANWGGGYPENLSYATWRKKQKPNVEVL